jgi:VanZ family protein
MTDNKLREQNQRAVLMVLWAVLICCTVVGSLLPASSPVMRAVGRLPVSQKVLHFCAYTSLALMALVAVRRRSAAVLAALAMILLGVALEFGQKLVPGRAFEIRDMFINGAGVLAGIAVGFLSRRTVPAVCSS